MPFTCGSHNLWVRTDNRRTNALTWFQQVQSFNNSIAVFAQTNEFSFYRVTTTTLVLLKLRFSQRSSGLFVFSFSDGCILEQRPAP